MTWEQTILTQRRQPTFIWVPPALSILSHILQRQITHMGGTRNSILTHERPVHRISTKSRPRAMQLKVMKTAGRLCIDPMVLPKETHMKGFACQRMAPNLPRTVLAG